VSEAQRTIPNPEAGGCLSLGALRSNPVIPTRGVSNHNQLRLRCEHRAKLASPGGASPWHHWWPQPGNLKLKVSQHRSGKSSSTVKGKILSGNKVIHHNDDRLHTEPLPFSSPSIFPIHPDAQSLHPETSINFSLCPQIPCSIHHTVHLAPLPYLAQVPPSHHFHCKHLRLTQQSTESTL